MAIVVSLLQSVGHAASAVGRSIKGLFLLVKDGESDVAETYPELQHPTGEQAAVNGSLFMGMAGAGHP